MDASLVAGGASFLSGAISAYYSNAVASIQANSANKVRAINNETLKEVYARDVELTALQRWAQQVRNSRVQENVASAQQAMATNFNRSRDARTRANFAANIRQAEEEGRMQAAAASSGVTGSVVDMLNDTSRLRYAMERTARMDAEAQVSYDYKIAELATRQSIEDGLDWSLIFDPTLGQDYYKNTTVNTNPLLAGLGNMSQKQLQGVASYFTSSTTDNSIFGMLGTNRTVGD